MSIAELHPERHGLLRAGEENPKPSKEVMLEFVDCSQYYGRADAVLAPPGPALTTTERVRFEMAFLSISRIASAGKRLLGVRQ